ncbi:MAG: transcription antitermination factor NusB [Clostridiales bacterium]|nr:transcription antitermination factor NusB [Clostridiales bacterium]
MSKAHSGTAPSEDYFKDFSTAGRRRARETALLMLYQLDFGGNDALAAEQTLNSLGLNEDNAGFARQLMENARALKPASDALIAEYSREWDFERLFNIDVAILRLALSELNSSTPANIVINEAVELAKKFGDEASPAFVNAVLDAVYQKQPGEAAT